MQTPLLYARAFGITLALTLLSGVGHAADRYWVAAGSSGTWNVVGSWSATSGGASGASVPGVADHAIFNGGSQTRCVINSVVSISSLTVSTSTVGGFTSNIDASTRTITVRGDVVMNNGTFYARTSSITVQGNWTVATGANFVANTSSVTFTGGVNKVIDTGGKQFYKLIFSGSGTQSWRTSGNPVTVSSHVQVLGGSYSIGGTSVTVAGGFNVTGGSTLTVNADLSVNGGSFNKNSTGVMTTGNSTSTVRLTGTGRLSGTGRVALLPNLDLSGAGTTTLDGALALTGSLTNGVGHTLDPSASNYGITLANSWANSGSYTIRTASITFNGTTADQTIQTNHSPMYALRINGSGSWTGINQPVTVSSYVFINAGTLQVAGTSWTVVGSIVKNGGILDIDHDVRIPTGGTIGNGGGSITSLSSATVTLSGAGNLGGSGSTTLPNLTLSGANTTSLMGNIAVAGVLTNGASHTLDVSASNFAITVSSDWANSGIFTMRTGSVTFNGAGLNQTIVTNNSPFYNLRFNGSGQWASLTNAVTVSSYTLVSAGTLLISAGSSWTVVGSVINNGGTLDIQHDLLVPTGGTIGNTGTMIANSTGTVTLTGAGNLGGTGSTTLPRLVMTGATTTSLRGRIAVNGALSNGSGHTLDVTASNHAITVSSSWVNSGVFSAQSGSVTFNGSGSDNRITTNHWRFYNLRFNGSGSWMSNVNPVTVSSSVWVNAGTYQVAGTSLSVTGDIDVTTGATLDIKNHILVSGGDLTNRGTLVSVSTPIVTLSGAGVLGGSGTNSLPQVTLSGAGTTTLGGPVVFLGSATIGTGHTLDTVASSNYQITISSWLANNGTFTPRQGTVVVNSAATLTGPTTFYIFSATTPGITITFQPRTTFYVDNALTLTGSSGNRINLRSIVPGTSWHLGSNGTESVTEVDAQDSDARASGIIVAASSNDSGNNRNWDFGIATKRTWWGGVSTNWSSSLNWDSGVPLSADSVLIVSTATRMPTLTGTVSISSLTVVPTSSITLNGFALTVSSMSVGGTLVLFGGEPVSTAPDLQSGSTVTYNATSGNRVVYSTWTYHHLVVAGAAAATFTPTGDMTVGGQLSLPSGRFLHGNRRITLNGSSNLLGITTTGEPLYDVDLNGTGIWVLQDSMTVINDLTISAGTLDAKAGVQNGILLGGEWLNTGGTYLTRNSSVTLASSSTGKRIRSGNSPFWKILTSGTGGWVTDTHALTVSSTVFVNAGTFQVAGGSSLTVAGNPSVAAGATLNIQGDMAINSGGFRNLGTVTGFSTATLSISGAGNIGGSGSNNFPGLTLSGGAQTTTLDSAITVQGPLTNGASHTLDVSASNFAITVSSSWANSGIFTMRTGSVTFNGAGLNQTIVTNNSPFYNLRFNGSGQWASLTNAVTVSSYTMVSAGTLLISAGSSWTVVGSVINNGGTLDIQHDLLVPTGGTIGNTGTMIANSTGTVTLSGAGDLGGTGSTTLPRLVMTGATTTSLRGRIAVNGALSNGSGHTLDVTASNHAITVSSSWVNSGVFSAQSGSVTFNGSGSDNRITTNHWRFYNLRFNGSGSWMSNVNPVTVSSSVWVNAGTYQVAGTSLSVTGDIDVTTGATLDIKNHILVSGGDLTNRGTLVSVSTPIVTLSGAGVLGGSGTNSLPQVTLSGAGTTTLGGPVVFLGSATIGTGHTLDTVASSNYQITISSWLANNGTFTPRQGTVVVNSAATLTGPTTFYNFSATTPGITITFQPRTTFYVDNALTLTGSSGNRINLRSIVPGTSWHLGSNGTESVTEVDAQDSDARASGIIVAASSNDSGNNRNWDFGIATKRTWWGGVSTNWSSSLNWDSGVPLSADSVLIVSTATRMPTLTGTVSISSLTVVPTSSITLNGFALTVSSMSVGGTLVLFGGEPVSTAPDLQSGSTVTYNATSGNRVVYSTWTYHHLVVAGAAAATFTPTGDMTVGGQLSLPSGRFLHGNRRITLNGSSNLLGITTTGEPLYDVDLNGTGIWVLQDSMTVINDLTISAGTLDAKAGVQNGILLGGEWLNSGGTYLTRNSSVTLASSSTGKRIRSGNSPFWKILTSGTGGWVTDTHALTVSSTVFVNAGTFQVAGGSSLTVAGNPSVAAGATLNIQGDMAINSGGFRNLGTVTGFSTATLSISGAGNIGGSGSNNFPGLTLSGGAQTTTLDGAITVQGPFSNGASHTLDVSASNFAITVSSSWANSGIFTMRTGSVTFNGAGLNQTIVTNNSPFYNLRFNGSGQWASLTNAVTVSSYTMVSAGTLLISAGSSWTVVGSVINNGGTLDIQHDLLVPTGGTIGNTGTMIANSTGTVTLSGAGDLGGTGSTTLPRLVMTGATTTSLRGRIAVNGALSNGSGHTLDVTASNHAITVSSSRVNSGVFSAQSGSVTFNGSGSDNRITTNHWRFYNLRFNGSGSWMSNVNPVTVSSSVWVNAGTYQVAGTSLSVTGDIDVTTGATLDIKNHILVSGGDLTNRGTLVSVSTPIVTLSGAGVLGGSGTNSLPQVTLSGAGTTTLGGPVVFLGSATIGTGHTLDTVASSNYQITISSWLANNGTFTPRQGTVVVNSAATLTGPTTFYIFSATTPGITITFQPRTTFYVDNALTLTGSSGNRINLRSIVPGTSWHLGSNGTESVTEVDAQDSDARASGIIVAASSNDSGNNRNWDFGIATKRTWWGGVSTNWSSSLNWDSGVPLSADSVLIVSTATRMPTLTGTVSISSLTVVPTSSITLNGFALTVSSMSVGGTLVLFGGEPVSTAPDLQSGSTVTYNATSGNRVVYSTWTYHHLVVAGAAAATFTPTGDMTVGGQLSLPSGRFLHGNRRITLNGSSNLLGITTTGEPLYDVDLNGTGIWVLQDSMTVINDLTISAGTLDAKAGVQNGILLGGEWLNTGGTYLTRNSSVTLASSSTGKRIRSGNSPFWKILTSGTGGWVTDTHALTVSSTVFVNAGTFQVAGGSSLTVAGNPSVAAGATLNIQGDMAINSGGFRNLGTVTGFSTATLSISGAGNIGGSGSNNFPGLTLSGGAQTTTLDSAITVQGPLTNGASHTLDVSASNFAITVSSSWANSGIFTMRTGSVTFNGAGLNQTIVTNNSPFYNLRFNGSGQWASLTNAVTVSSYTMVSAGTLLISAGSSWTVVGSVINNGGTLDIQHDLLVPTGGTIGNTGTMIANSTGTVTLSGAGDLGGTGSTTLPRLVMTGATTTSLRGRIAVNGALSNGSGHTLDVTASNHAITVSSSWVNSGVFSAQSGSVTFNGSGSDNRITTNHWRFYNLRFNGSGSWMSNVNPVTVSSSVWVNAGTYQVAGTSLSVTGDIDVTTGATLDIKNHILVSGGDLTNRGTLVSVSTPIVTLSGAGVLGGSGTNSLPQVTLSGAGTTTLGGPVVFLGSATIGTGHTLDTVASSNYQITISSWLANNGTFTPRLGTVVVNSAATLTGSTTFYNFTAVTPGITMTFQSGATFYVDNALTLSGAPGNRILLRPTGASGYAFRVRVSSFVYHLDVQNCVASSQTIYAGQASINNGGNANWVFDFPPNAIQDLAANRLLTGDVRLSWSVPFDADDSPLPVNSQYAIHWSTYAANWSTSTIGDTGQSNNHHIYVTTGPVTFGDPQIYTSTGLAGGVTYYFQIWTKDAFGQWSHGLSNNASEYPVNVLGVDISVASYDFLAVPMNISTITMSGITISNTGNVDQTYSVSISSATNWTVLVATPTAMDQYALFGLFNVTQPPLAAFTNIDVITSTPTPSTALVYSAGGQTGVSVPMGNPRTLWLRLDMPSSTTTEASQSFTLSVTGSAP